MNTYKPKDFAKMLGVTVRTLQKWDVAGKLKAFRTPTNRRFYTQEQLDVYSCRIYGLRKYRGKLKGDETVAQILQDRTSAHRKPKG